MKIVNPQRRVETPLPIQPAQPSHNLENKPKNSENIEYRWKTNAPHLRFLNRIKGKERTIGMLMIAIPINLTLLYVVTQSFDPNAKEKVEASNKMYIRPVIPGDK